VFFFFSFCLRATMAFNIHAPISWTDYELVSGSAKDEDPPVQKRVEVSMSPTMTPDLSRYILHMSDLLISQSGDHKRYRLEPKLATSLHFQHVSFCREVVKAGNGGALPLTPKGDIFYHIPRAALEEVTLSAPPFGSHNDLYQNPLVVEGSKELVMEEYQRFQRRMHKLEAWVRFCQKQSMLHGLGTLWMWPAQARPPRCLALRPGWRLDKQVAPDLFTLEDIWGMRRPSGGSYPTEQLNLLTEKLIQGHATHTNQAELEDWTSHEAYVDDMFIYQVPLCSLSSQSPEL